MSGSQGVEGSLRDEPSGGSRAQVVPDPIVDKPLFVVGFQFDGVVQLKVDVWQSSDFVGGLLEYIRLKSYAEVVPGGDGRRFFSNPRKCRSSFSAMG